MDIFKLAFSNHIINCALIGWFLAQTIKGFIYYFSNKKMELDRFIGSGGMPSSHSSMTAALSTAVLLFEGFNSTAFAISAIITCIILYDASGVRYAVGEHAKMLNILKNKEENNDIFQVKDFKELVGHTKFQVLIGFILGVIVSVVYYYIMVNVS